jgi:DNA repair exonuclease SbcCD ATPase subunit
MKIKLDRLELENFKGISHRICNFNSDLTDIRGCNGGGKTTIASAIMFVLFDIDYQFNAKPMMQPIDNPEVKPRVKLWLDVDGRQITVEKTQKTVVKYDENSGKTSMTTSNTYAVNDVPKTLRDYTQYMTELGIDLDKMLILMHPDAFLKDMSAKGREKMREMLFEMVSAKTDAEIASEDITFLELKGLLTSGYKVEEIKAMNNATIRKIISENGKDNALIDARIQGLIEGKANVDLTKAIADKEELNLRLEEIKAQMSDDGLDHDKDNEIAELVNRRNKIIEDANKANNDKRSDLQTKIQGLSKSADEIHNKISSAQREIGDINNTKNYIEKKIEELRNQYKAEMDRDVYVSETCPYCGQALPQEDVEKTKAKMVAEKESKIAKIKTEADSEKQKAAACEKKVAELEQTIKDITPALEEAESEIENLRKDMQEIPAALLVDDIPEAKALQAEISTLAAERDKSSSEKPESLRKAYDEITSELSAINAELAKAENNAEIDDKVEELRDKKRRDEITKAGAEKILDLVDRFEKFKNGIMETEVNKHFSLVKWKLFETLKNGEIKSACIATYKGKAINEQTNAALTMQLKLDIAMSLQRYNGLYVPIIQDEAERLDSKSRASIQVETQLIYLTVSDDKELQGI